MKDEDEDEDEDKDEGEGPGSDGIEGDDIDKCRARVRVRASACLRTCARACTGIYVYEGVYAGFRERACMPAYKHASVRAYRTSVRVCVCVCVRACVSCFRRSNFIFICGYLYPQVKPREVFNVCFLIFR